MHHPSHQELHDWLTSLSATQRDILAYLLQRKAVVRDIQREMTERATFGQKAADAIARFGGSWVFLGLFALALGTWISLHALRWIEFDPYPFILLNLLLSCLAAVQAPIILMSQNRQAEKDRLTAQHDYEVNLKAEMEIMALHGKLDELRDAQWSRLLELQERQLAVLERLENRPA